MKKNKKKKRKRLYKYWVFGICFIFFITASLKYLNTYIEPRLQAIAKQHVGFAINNIVKEVLKDMEYNHEELSASTLDDKGNVVSVEYNSYKLNQLLYSALNTIDDALKAAQDGKIDPTTEEVFYEDGIIYQVPLGALTRISFFSTLGPRIPVKMNMLNDVTGEIQTSSEPYGVNNTMVKVVLSVQIRAQVITVLGVGELETKTEVPIIMQLVNGRVPVYLPNTTTTQKE